MRKIVIGATGLSFTGDTSGTPLAAVVVFETWCLEIPKVALE